jgi:hypothetical protein
VRAEEMIRPRLGKSRSGGRAGASRVAGARRRAGQERLRRVEQAVDELIVAAIHLRFSRQQIQRLIAARLAEAGGEVSGNE